MEKGIENFWNQAKRVLRKYNEIDRKSFPPLLKEKAAVKNSAALV
nr:hypothetical protein [Neisseria dumasiana]